MTRLPHENRDVVGLDGPVFPRYRVGPLCSVPGCSRPVDHVHHIWRRSFVIGDKPWVKLWDGKTIGNLTGLCWRHHEQVTVGESRIDWMDSFDQYWWKPAEGWSGALDPQPPQYGSSQSDESPPEKESEDPVCETCKRPLRARHSHSPGEKRRRATWTVQVPDDAENGAEVLDELVAQVAERWGMDEFTSALRRYHVLVPALYAIIANDITIGEG